MEKFITWATIACFILGGCIVSHVIIMYLINNAVVLKISAWVFGIVFGFSLLRKTVRALIESDWLENSFKSNKK